jgi:hypothetical protein
MIHVFTTSVQSAQELAENYMYKSPSTCGVGLGRAVREVR